MARNNAGLLNDVESFVHEKAQELVQFAKRVGVDPVTVARWETGQRRCTGTYAEAIAHLDPERRRSAAPKDAGGRDNATVSALAQLVRTLFQGSTAQAVSALLDHEKLSDRDLDELSRLIVATAVSSESTTRTARM